MAQEEEKILKDYENELYKECSKIEDEVDRMNFLIGIPAKLQQKQKMLFIKRVVLKYGEAEKLYDFEKDEIDMERTMKSAFVHYTGEYHYKFHTDKWDGTNDIVSIEKINNVKL